MADKGMRYKKFMNFVCSKRGIKPTQTALGEILGVSQASIGRWISGDQTPGRSAVESIREKVGEHWIRYLLFNEGPDDPARFDEECVFPDGPMPDLNKILSDDPTEAQEKLVARVDAMIEARQLEVDQLRRLRAMILADKEFAEGVDHRVFEQFLTVLGRRRENTDQSMA